MCLTSGLSPYLQHTFTLTSIPRSCLLKGEREKNPLCLPPSVAWSLINTSPPHTCIHFLPSNPLWVFVCARRHGESLRWGVRGSPGQGGAGLSEERLPNDPCCSEAENSALWIQSAWRTRLGARCGLIPSVLESVMTVRERVLCSLCVGCCLDVN